MSYVFHLRSNSVLMQTFGLRSELVQPNGIVKTNCAVVFHCHPVNRSLDFFCIKEYLLHWNEKSITRHKSDNHSSITTRGIIVTIPSALGAHIVTLFRWLR